MRPTFVWPIQVPVIAEGGPFGPYPLKCSNCANEHVPVARSASDVVAKNVVLITNTAGRFGLEMSSTKSGEYVTIGPSSNGTRCESSLQNGRYVDGQLL